MGEKVTIVKVCYQFVNVFKTVVDLCENNKENFYQYYSKLIFVMILSI